MVLYLKPLKELYPKNHLLKMNYSKIIEMKLPIGSGVTEAACKVIVKEKMCKVGMRWNDDGAHAWIT